MRISVKIKPNSKISKVEQSAEGLYKVSVTAPAQDGKANKALIETLSEYFKVAKSKINIVSGQTSKNKIIEIKEG